MRIFVWEIRGMKKAATIPQLAKNYIKYMPQCNAFDRIYQANLSQFTYSIYTIVLWEC